MTTYVTFTPPTFQGPNSTAEATRPERAVGRIANDRPTGYSLIRVSGVWTQIASPSVNLIATADTDTDGQKLYLAGGHEHTIIEATYAGIVSAGIVTSLPALALGTVASAGAPGTPPSGAAYQAYDAAPRFTIQVPGLDNRTVTLAVKEPDATEVGTIMCFGGEGGTFWWGADHKELYIDQWVDLGWRVVQIKYDLTVWENSGGIHMLGPVKMAARGATIIDYVHNTYCGTVDNLYLLGQSGGADQIAYSMIHYGASDYVRFTGLTGGPPKAAIVQLCSGDPNYGSDSDAFGGYNFVDSSFGFPSDTGPCFLHTSTSEWQTRWDAESVVGSSPRTYRWPLTRVHFQWGARDDSGAPASGLVCANKLRAAGQAVTAVTIPNADHNGAISTAAGIATMDAALFGKPVRLQVRDFGPTATTDINVPFASAPNVGSLLVVVVLNSSSPGAIPTPDGWRRDTSVSASTNSIVVLSKVAEDGDTGIAFTVLRESNTEVILYEVAFLANATLDKTSSVTSASVAAGGTVSVPSTGTTVAAIEWCLMAAATAPSRIGDPTDSFVMGAESSRLHTAMRTLTATETLEPTFTYEQGGAVAALVVTYKAG